MEKAKYSFFCKPSKKDDISLRLPKLVINDYEIQREEYRVSWGFIRVTLNMERIHKTYWQQNCQKHRDII